ncbi:MULTISPECIES: hypothetical protein [Falsihalocynthiibacter]|uniref:hypothetical protein n=1 Tax=Falsihalocynthiibacter TaxID=2854182 RepID=UPI00300211CF
MPKQILKKIVALSGLSLLIGSSAIGEQVTRANTSYASLSELANGQEKSFNAYLTGYSYWDNTPPGSAAIARPVIHKRAGGTGSYNDPITIAVGHSIVGGKQTLDFPSGTRFYIGSIQKYAIVEDVCGDGPTPQGGPCHTGRNGLPWLDIYVGGRRAGPEIADECMRRITAVHTFIINPRSGYPVIAGELSNNCQILSS